MLSNKGSENRYSLLIKFIFGLVIGVIFFIIYDLNKIYPFFTDDWDYHFVYYGDHKIQSVFEVFPSMVKHYTMWGGRLVVHGILQELLYFGPWWCDFLNSIVFVIYILLIYLIANRGNKPNLFLLCFIFLLVWFFQPNLGLTTLWITGSVNYLWGTCIVLLFLYPYYAFFTDNYYQKEKISLSNDNIWRSIAFLFAGIIAGWTNETTAVSLVLILTAFLIIQKYKIEGAIPNWSIWGGVGAFIGTALMLLAPGNFRRFRIEMKNPQLEESDFSNTILKHILDYKETFSSYALVLLLVCLACILLFGYLRTRDTQYKRIRNVATIFLVSALISSFEFLVVLQMSGRAWFGIVTLIIIAISIIYANLDFSRLYIKLFSGGVLLIGVFFCIKGYKEGRCELLHKAEIINTREIQVLRQKQEGKVDIVLTGGFFEEYTKSNITLGLADFPKDDPEAWIYKAYIRYYDIHSVKIVD